MINVRLATLQDLEGLDYAEWMGPVSKEAFEHMNMYAVEEDKKVICLGGVFKLREKVGMTFVVATDNVKNKIGLFRIIRAYLWEEMCKLDLFRVEAHTKHGQGEKLLKALGFEFEGICKCYDGYEDYKQYALVVI